MATAPSSTDAVLVRRLRERDRSAWDEVYAEYGSRLRAFAYRLSGNSHDADDLVQETFVRALPRLDRLDPETATVGPYLFTTLRNIFLKSVKRGGRSEPVADVPEPSTPAPIEDDPERSTLLHAQQDEVRIANARLAPRQRLVLAMRELEDRSYAEIGETVGLSENAVAQLISRARESLRTELRLAQIDPERLPEECRRFLPLLSRHLDGQLRGAQLEQTLAHLERCERCQDALASMQEAKRRYRVLVPLAFGAQELFGRIDDALAANGYWSKPPLAAGRLRSRAAVVAVAAAVVLLGAAGAGTAVLVADDDPVATAAPMSPPTSVKRTVRPATTTSPTVTRVIRRAVPAIPLVSGTATVATRPAPKPSSPTTAVTTTPEAPAPTTAVTTTAATPEPETAPRTTTAPTTPVAPPPAPTTRKSLRSTAPSVTPPPAEKAEPSSPPPTTTTVTTTTTPTTTSTTTTTPTPAPDTTAPTVVLLARPAAQTTSGDASFSFRASERGSNFSCELDGAGFAPCSSPAAHRGLPPGPHAFAVRATDLARNTGPAATASWTVLPPPDTTPPTVVLHARPAAQTTSGNASFSFRASERGSSFSCQLDGAGFSPCWSPAAHRGLAPGAHAFAVRATDLAGNTGPAATASWTVLPPPDTTAPTARIVSATTPGSDATFEFTSSEAASTFSCSLDRGTFESCTSPRSHSGLAPGTHTFAVRATDAAGNTGAPATHTWTIAQPLPDLIVSSLGETSFTVTNIGTAPAGPFVVSVTLIGTFTFAGLAPGESQTRVWSACRIGTLTAIADRGAAVVESNEDNNSRSLVSDC